LKVKHGTWKLLEENIATKLLDMGLGDDFLVMTPKAQATKKINKWDYIKLKSFCAAKKKTNQKHQKSEKTTYGMGKIFANHVSDKGLISPPKKYIYIPHTIQ